MKALRGITLLELMVVLAILVVMASFVIPALGEWKRKYDIEHTIKTLYAALNEARMKAFSQKRVCGLLWNNSPLSQVELRCDTDADGDLTDTNGYERIWTKSLKVPLEASFGGMTQCAFNSKGFADTWGNFHYSGQGLNPDYSCVTVARTRIKMGEWDGENCNPK